MIAADFIADQLSKRGVRQVFGVGGANIEDLFAAVQRQRPAIRMVLGKHEHALDGVGSAIVCEGDRVLGVFTTADALRALHRSLERE